jgi:hypothetical protein
MVVPGMATDVAEGVAAPAPRPQGAGPRVRLLIAILIAATSVLAGVATWRSDAADRARTDTLNAADLQARERQGAIEEIDANLNDSRITLVRVRVNDRRAAALTAESRARGVSPEARRRAAALAAGYRAMAAVIRERIDPNVLAEGATPAGFKRAHALLLTSAAARRDLDPAPELKTAADLNQRADDLRVLGVAALIAALLLTCAEVLRSSWYRLFLALGVIAIAAAAVGMISVGFAA